MSIRFRCFFCGQLLGIARRKAGTVITCPNCKGQLWVPDPDRPEEMQADPAVGPGEIDVELVPLPPATDPRALLRLTPRGIRVLLLALLVLLLLLFGAGLWIGRSLRS
jgi:hypothetical protein